MKSSGIYAVITHSKPQSIETHKSPSENCPFPKNQTRLERALAKKMESANKNLARLIGHVTGLVDFDIFFLPPRRADVLKNIIWFHGSPDGLETQQRDNVGSK